MTAGDKARERERNTKKGTEREREKQKGRGMRTSREETLREERGCLSTCVSLDQFQFLAAGMISEMYHLTHCGTENQRT